MDSAVVNILAIIHQSTREPSLLKFLEGELGQNSLFQRKIEIIRPASKTKGVMDLLV